MCQKDNETEEMSEVNQKSEDQVVERLLNILNEVASELKETAAAVRALNSEVRTLGYVIRNK